jgi:hypothetical protein
MRISYRRTGGFAGMVMKFDLATETLPQEDADELQELVASADFFSLPDVIPSDPRGADRFQYQLTIEHEEQQHTVKVGDGSMPENLWPLLDKIRVLSRASRNH